MVNPEDTQVKTTSAPIWCEAHDIENCSVCFAKNSPTSPPDCGRWRRKCGNVQTYCGQQGTK